ncbi:MAG: ABC transporter substrate-binding protein [Anaerolineae bacterium]
MANKNWQKPVDERSSTSGKRLTRRMFLRVGALAGTGLLAAACQPAPAPQAAPTTAPKEVVAEPTAAPKQPVTLRYQNHWSKETDAHYEGMNWLFKEFGDKYPEIKIENILNPDSEESRKKILADCAAGDCPDIIHETGADMWGGGYVLDLMPHLDADADWKALFSQDALNAFSTDGHVWGLSAEVSPLPTIWNMRILEAAGVDEVPATWDDFLATCEKVKAAGKLATSWGVGGSHQWHNIIAGQKGGLDALAANDFAAPQLEKAFELLKVFVDNKWVPDNEIELTWQQSVALFVAEETAFYLNGAWTIGNEITGQGAAADLKDNVAFVPYPSVAENGTTLELKLGTPIGLAKKLEEDSAKLDAGITFIKFLFSEEAAKQWILLCKSPMGVKVDVKSIEGVDPLLVAFLDAQYQADTAYSLPGTKAMQQRGWDDCWTGLQTLLAGKSVEDAMAALQSEMSEYISG